jgi:dihydrolipoamide dehydrogenase
MADYDVIIVGGGPGGYAAAERLGAAKKRVLLVEKSALGGTCLNVGCIPTKTLINSAKIYAHARDGMRFGVKASDISFDWSAMQAWKREVVEKLRAAIAVTEKKYGVEVVQAEARLLGPGRVELHSSDGSTLVHGAQAIVAACGSEPIMPPIPGVRDNPRVLDSTALLEIDEVPARLCVIGGGVIGVEFAGLFSALGSKVEVIEMMDEIVPFMDREQAPILRRAMKDVTFRLGCRVESIEAASVRYTTQNGLSAVTEADVILLAVGRRPLVSGWGAKEAGLDVSPRGVVVDERMRTNLPMVWAVGDVTGRSLLAHSAYRMADVASSDILGGGGASRGPEVMRYGAVPWVLYGLTEAAGVGMTEAAAREAGYDVKKASLPLRVSGRFCAEAGFAAPGSVKVVADRSSDRILGVHLVGSYASEMIWGAAALIEQEMRVRDVKEIVFPHPTVCEAISDAVKEL